MATFLRVVPAALCFCFCVNLRAQDTLVVTRSVVSTAGGEDTAFTEDGLIALIAQWNLGETITEEFGTGGGNDASFKRLTQGFEQGEGYIVDPLKDKMDSLAANEREHLAADGFKVVLWPNPAREKVHAEIVVTELLQNHWFNVELRRLSGQVVGREKLPAGRFELGLEALPSGLYLLSATDVATRKTFVCKLIKVL